MKKIKIIIAEDEPRIRRGIERMILQCGEEWEVVGTFANGDKVLKEVGTGEFQFDVLITDIKMPIVDGLTLIKRLKDKNYSFLPVIVSGFDDFELLQDALREGAVDYMLKPINRNHFKEQMAKVKKRVEEKRALEQQLEEVEQSEAKLSYATKLHYLSELTWNTETDLSALQWTKEFPDTDYSLLHISLDNLATKEKSLNSSDWELWRFAVENILHELTEPRLRQNQCWLWRGENVSYWVLMQKDEETEDLLQTVYNLAQEMKRNIQKCTPFTFSIAIGNSFSDLSLLPSIRDHLQTLIQNRIIHGGNRIYSPLSLIELSNDSNSNVIPIELYRLVQHLIIAVEKMDMLDVEKQLHHFFKNIRKLESPILITQIIQFYTISMANHFITNNGSMQISMDDIFHRIKTATEFSELKTLVIHWTKQLFDENKGRNQKQDVVELAKDWIKTNVRENVTIAKVAQQVHMNPNYFCEVFKNQTGETVLDYVTRVKMTRAKQLLIHSDMKVYDIATEVGYKDTKYFSRLYKQYMGEVPSKYRELYK